MGSSLSHWMAPHLWRQDEPDSMAPPKYEPEFGFEDYERKPRVMIATEAEMDSANFSWTERDLCTHLKIEYHGCLDTNYFTWYKCKGIEHEIWDCYKEHRLQDMKEFERERRLNARERRIQEKLDKGIPIEAKS